MNCEETAAPASPLGTDLLQGVSEREKMSRESHAAGKGDNSTTRCRIKVKRVSPTHPLSSDPSMAAPSGLRASFHGPSHEQDCATAPGCPEEEDLLSFHVWLKYLFFFL